MRLAALCQEPITSTLHGLTHLSHTTNLWGRYYCPVLQRRKRSCQRPLAQVPDLWRGQADWRLRSHVPWEASPLRTPGGNLLFPFLRQLCADLDYSIFSGRLPLLVSEASFCPCGDLLGAMVHVFYISDLISHDVSRLTHHWCLKHFSSESDGRISHRKSQWAVPGVHWQCGSNWPASGRGLVDLRVKGRISTSELETLTWRLEIDLGVG